MQSQKEGKRKAFFLLLILASRTDAGMAVSGLPPESGEDKLPLEKEAFGPAASFVPEISNSLLQAIRIYVIIILLR